MDRADIAEDTVAGMGSLEADLDNTGVHIAERVLDIEVVGDMIEWVEVHIVGEDIADIVEVHKIAWVVGKVVEVELKALEEVGNMAVALTEGLLVADFGPQQFEAEHTLRLPTCSHHRHLANERNQNMAYQNHCHQNHHHPTS